jgi:hypothetical protein
MSQKTPFTFCLIAVVCSLFCLSSGVLAKEKRQKTYTVTHGPVETLMMTRGSTGHELGDLRILPATPIFDLQGHEIGRLDANLITTSVDYPTYGDEIRMSTLNFVFGTAEAAFSGSAHQIVVAGSGFYPGDQSTIAVGNELIRPITGGSGKYQGATGSALTEHLEDGSWRHTFVFARQKRLRKLRDHD